MTQSRDEKVASLLQQGLELYGTGEVAKAFVVWREVLELEPGNEEALDYMRDADRRSRPRDRSAPGVANVEEARRLVHAQDAEAAYELLTSVGSDGHLESDAMIELLRAKLFRRYRRALGDLSQVPRVAGESADLKGRNLPPSAGFLLSMVDGATPLADLVSVSGMDRFEALRSIQRMHDAGILEWNG